MITICRITQHIIGRASGRKNFAPILYENECYERKSNSIGGSKRHILQSMDPSQGIQTAVQIVSKPPDHSNGDQIYLLGGGGGAS